MIDFLASSRNSSRVKPVILAAALLALPCWSSPSRPGIETRGFVRYSDFGAVGDGERDDFDAIIAAHAFANEHELPVKADEGASYYIGGGRRTAVIETDTDFGSAEFIIDDKQVKIEDRGSDIFRISSRHASFTVAGVDRLHRGQKNIGRHLPMPSLLIARDSKTKRFIRHGGNRNSGKTQTDIFLVDREGNIHPETPIIWDFDQISELKAYPLDEERLTVSGGKFTTIANSAPSQYTYYACGISIQRSNVLIEGMEHLVTGEGEQGAPYRGFISVQRCAHVTVRDTTLTGRKTYQTIGSAGTRVSMGSYDINIGYSSHVAFRNVDQSNDITDRRYWGIMGSNYCKNLLYEDCKLSRFDAHCGVYNASIENSQLRDITLIGWGIFNLSKSRVYGRSFITLRRDYGSTWNGEFHISDSVWKPQDQINSKTISIINGRNNGRNDFGYTCYMPRKISIDNLVIDDKNVGGNYKGPSIFGDFNPRLGDEGYVETEHYVRTGTVILEGIVTTSGKALSLSPNTEMFKDVEVYRR